MLVSSFISKTLTRLLRSVRQAPARITPYVPLGYQTHPAVSLLNEHTPSILEASSILTNPFHLRVVLAASPTAFRTMALQRLQSVRPTGAIAYALSRVRPYPPIH